MAGKIIQLPLPFEYVLDDPQNWHECDWRWWTVSHVRRPTEDAALENVRRQALSVRKTGGLLEFNDDMWLVYFVDLELRFRWRNGKVLAVDIGRALKFSPERVTACLRMLDEVIQARIEFDLPTLPPVPIRHIRRQRALQRLARAKAIEIAA